MIIRDGGKRHIAWFDVHVPRNNDLSGPLGFAHDTGCDNFIIGGDFLNLEWASHWNEKVFPEIGRTQLRQMLFQELEAGAKTLKEIRKAIGPKPKLWYIPGNHESWLWYACFYHRVVEVPDSIASVTFKSDVAQKLDEGLGLLLARLLDAKGLDMKVLPYREPLQIGRVVYLHGDQFGGQNPTQTSARRWPHVNMVFGHHHTHLVTTIYNGADPRDVHQHVAVPALCGLAPGYLHDKSTRWLNGFFVCDISREGYFDGRVLKCFDGKIVMREHGR